jgi:hypothetical protein
MAKQPPVSEFNAEVYRTAAQEHIVSAAALYEVGHYGLTIYVAGLAVECLLTGRSRSRTMAALKPRVRRILAEEFNGARIDLERETPEDKITGSLVWDGFEGKDQLDRQLAVRGILRSKLAVDQAAQVGLIITVTPDEMAVLREG